MTKAIIFFFSTLLGFNAYADLSEPPTLARIACRKIGLHEKVESGVVIFDQLPTAQQFGAKTTVLDGKEFIKRSNKYPTTYSSYFRIRYFENTRVGKSEFTQEFANDVSLKSTPHDLEGVMNKLFLKYQFDHDGAVDATIMTDHLEAAGIEWKGVIKIGPLFTCLPPYTVPNPNYQAVQPQAPSVTGSIVDNNDHQDANAGSYAAGTEGANTDI